MHLVRGPIRPGARLGLFCPGSAPEQELVARAARFLERAGYAWRFGRVAGRTASSAPTRMHAASPADRAAEVLELAQDPEVDALLAVRGGTGTLGILPLLDYAKLASAGKCVIGMSDVTALSLALLARAGLPSLAAPMAVQIGAPPPDYTVSHWRAALQHGEPLGAITTGGKHTLRTLVAGEAEGPLLACNLSLLVSVIGTPYCPKLDGAILLLEDIGETPQSLDRMVDRLRISGATHRLAGVVLGQFTRCLSRVPDVLELDGRDVVHAWATSLGVPVVEHFPFGHEPVCASLPFGARARLSTEPPTLALLDTIWEPRTDS